MAPQKLMVTPGIIKIVSATIAAFKITVNTPSVRNNNGNENIIAIGRTTEFTIENTKPATTYSQPDSRRPSEPSANSANRLMQIIIATVEINQRTTNVAICFFIITNNLF